MLCRLDPRPVIAFWSPERRARHRRLADALIQAGWRDVDALRLAHDQIVAEENLGYLFVFQDKNIGETPVFPECHLGNA